LGANQVEDGRCERRSDAWHLGEEVEHARHNSAIASDRAWFDRQLLRLQ
jgi:hypothetical protein